MENNNKKKIWILLGVIAVIIIIIVVAASQSQKGGQQVTQTPGNNVTGEENPADTEIASGTEVAVNPVLENATVEVPGTNYITADDKVVTQTGEETKTDVSPMSPVAPQQSGPVAVGSLSGNVIKITATVGKGYEPAEFTVNRGAAVTLSLTSSDLSHGLVFDDPALQAVGIAVSGGETRAITFNAPTTAGEYTFHCTLPPHAASGEVGKMIVR